MFKMHGIAMAASSSAESLMRQQVPCEVRRSQVIPNTLSDNYAPCPLDLVNRTLKADRPNQF